MKQSIRQLFRPLAVRIAEALPLRPLLLARERFDRRLTAGERRLRAPLAIRIGRLRPIPPAVRSFSPPGRPDLRFVNAESMSLQMIYWLGMDEAGRHAAGTRVWESLCARSRDVVEVGANVGFYAVPGARAARGRYRTFEPHPRSAQVLRSNLAENGIERAEVIEAAVVPDDWKASVRLTWPAGRDWATPASAGMAVEGGDGVDVKAVPVREAIAGCDLLKLDVEGLECALLRACLPALSETSPLLMLEVLDPELRLMLPEVVSALGAEAFAMGLTALRPVTPEALRDGPIYDVYGTWDYLIVPASRSSALEGLVA
jgi:FkbM family methyltransferase